MGRCQQRTEVYNRVVGYMRPIEQWNPGKIAEFRDRTNYVVAEDSPAMIGVSMSDGLIDGLQQAM